MDDNTHLGLDHVDASGAEGLHTVVDVHHPLTLGHIQHDVQNDVAAGPTRPHAVRRKNNTTHKHQYTEEIQKRNGEEKAKKEKEYCDHYVLAL